MEFDIEESLDSPISCLRALTTEDLFKETLKELYSQRYFRQHQSIFGSHLFIFQLQTSSKTWSLLKDDQNLIKFLRGYSDSSIFTSDSLDHLNTIQTVSKEEQAIFFEKRLNEILTSKPDSIHLEFFQSQREGFGSFNMKKRSGGRYRETHCCKIGSIFGQWKQRKVTVFLKGVAYSNRKQQLKEFLSFGQGFNFQLGKPSTGFELGLNLLANHRQLSLQALSVKDFIYFIFILRNACKESCYMSLNRFNSFSPMRYSNSTRFYVDGQDYFSAIAQALTQAKKSIMILGWMLSPQFLLKREGYQLTVESVLEQAAKKGVKISIILYHESCFLSNGSQYAKQTLQKYPNIKVICHPCGKMPVLWSHHGKIVVVDERQAFVGGLDLCYGRYDSQTHSLFPPSQQFPGLQHNNIRKNDHWDVKHPKESALPKHQCRLPWHDVSQRIKGEAVADLAHHFNQLWNFILHQNNLNPHDSFAPSLFESEVVSVFSTKHIKEEKQDSILRSIQNRWTSIKIKGKQFFTAKGGTALNHQNIQSNKSQNYFQQYLKQVGEEIHNLHSNQKQAVRKNSSSSSKRSSGSRSIRYSAADMKDIQKAIAADCTIENEDQIAKTNSFLLCGEKKADFFALEIDSDYLSCLQKVKNSQNIESQRGRGVTEVDSDEEVSNSNLYMGGDSQLMKEGRDQCQVVRSVGNWSIGCHSSNSECSIQIAYLQLISQAKHYIYIENQFFISSLADPNTVKNQVAEALYFRIRKAIKLNQRFVVYVVLPLLPGFSGDLEIEDCTMLRKQMQWQYDTISRGDNSLWQKLLNHTNDPSQYIQFFGLRQHGRINQNSQPQTEMIYVHSKLMIVDDQVVVCGSANINDRSLLGDRDSQIGVISRGDDFVEGQMNGEHVLVSQLAQELRIKLWKEHFGFTQEQIADPVSSQAAIENRAAKNTDLYRQVFGCYPDDQMATQELIQTVRVKSQISLYDKLSVEIKGHVVQFPMRFLEKEPATCQINEKEFFMPTECLT